MTPRQLSRLALLSLACALAPTPAHAAEECGPDACVSGAGWASGEQLDDSARAREAKRNRKNKDVQLTVQVANGRGSVFVDGVWIAPVPALYVPIKPGKHDLEVRDGERVIARGVLTIPKKAGEVSVRVF
ncbi:hypothetical protein [Enhygromyxa salina]|uniref:PEGA domain-containing protein n=1 Tax=Enhygromyxa salina TaxID=215803 RepID=A0A2S9XL73_9BACT|nr:hypothetical protein [Enhygromyxa salina]PRP93634.1 hypothetical protein ENSA7_80620 [Enhygromyxa salina]